MKRKHFISVLLLLVAGPNTNIVAQELTGEELEVWTALEEQINAFFMRDMETHTSYLHPKSVWWGSDDYAPYLAEKGLELREKRIASSENNFIGFYITPLSVTVTDDVAIINFIFNASSKTETGVRSWSMKGHNT